MKGYIKFYDAIGNVDLTDEKAVWTALNKSGLHSKSQIFPLMSLHFELTSHCNMLCKHCYNKSGGKNKSDAMTVEKWIDFAKYLVERGGVFECLLSGGEPFLFGDKVFDIMDVLHDDGTLFLFMTNGYFLTADRAKRLSKYHYHWLQISIDGADADYHDSFRSCKGSWEKAVKAAKIVAEFGIPLKITHCVTPDNLHEIDKMCTLAYSLGATSILVGEICFSGRAAENKNLFLNAEQKNILRQKVNENFERYKGRMKVKTSNPVRYGLERQLKSPRSSAVIRPNGDIRLDGMTPFVAGNILRDDFEEIFSHKIEKCWQNPAVLKFISEFDDDDKNFSTINYLANDVYL